METDSKGNVISNSYNTCELRGITSADLVNWTDHGTIKVNEVATWAKNIPGRQRFVNGKKKMELCFISILQMVETELAYCVQNPR